MDNGQILAEILVGGELRIHLIGVAGSGMSGIAGLLLSLGHHVSGSDKVTTVETERLQQLGLEFDSPPNGKTVADADLVIFSSAVRQGNPDYDAALSGGKSMVRRADALAAIMNCKKGILVAGMHGKTTTAAMAAHVLRAGGLHPSHYVGAEIPILGTNSHWDARGEYFVAEGDESDGTLALYRPEHTIVLNIEEEHLDYFDNLEAIQSLFRQALDQTRGTIFFCADDPPLAELCARRPNAIAFGRSHSAGYHYRDFEMSDLQSRFEVWRGEQRLGQTALNVPGEHNVSNALSVIALATELGISFNKIAAALESFRGAKRRFEIKYRSDRYVVVDDYAHHPTEIRATVATAKSSGRNRVVVMFQPHRYTRTKALRDQFGRSFEDASLIFVTDVYPASEPPLDGVSGATIAEAIVENGHLNVHYEVDARKMLLQLGRALEAGDLILSLGAGDIHELSTLLGNDLAVLEELQTAMGPGVASLYEPLSKHTTLRVGGPAQFWLEPETESGFAELVRLCRKKQIPLTVIGRGSNLLVRDGGLRGAVVHLQRGEFRQLRVNGTQITAGVGVKLRELSYAARDAGIASFEFFEGIPGNVGGGLRMNAGAMGGETFDNVVSVRFVDSDGNICTKQAKELEIHYRNVPSLRKNYAVAATFVGQPGDREEIKRLLDESMQKRRATQPAASSAGCIFKNPDSCPAGKLVDELGLKNASVGNARVSDVHGNFIVNDGGATASEVLELIKKIQATAQRERGIELETEVEIVGEPDGFH